MNSQSICSRTALLVAALVLLGGCAGIQTGSYYDETVDFAAYRTFSWVGEDPYIPGDTSIPVSPLAREKIKNAIRYELERKGYEYRPDSANADFGVSYTIGTRDKVRIESYPPEFQVYWGRRVPYQYVYYQHVSQETYTRGTLGIDIFELETARPIWHGWAEKTVTESDRRDPDEVIREGVAGIFADFPG